MTSSAPSLSTRTPELLAPAGDWDAMRAAVANGADAVYFGLDQFNARHRAANFKLDELPQIVAYLHDHNVKGFLTFNTLIFSDELPAATDYIKAIAAAGIDAVIVQDLGVANLIRHVVPGLHVHGSTQMTLTEPRGIGFVAGLGVKRVVLARELSVADIGRVAEATDMPLEVFAHGALCVAYSGQCLTSESFGGRSANRGQCAQACRLPYELIVDGTHKPLGDKNYLLSPQDLAAYDLVGDLAALGVASLKIEGRLKSAHYVAATTQTYRRALDAAAHQVKFKVGEQQRGDLEQTFSRGFSHGFLSGVNHQKLVVARFPKSRGRRIGQVRSATRQGVVIDVQTNDPVPLKPGDGVVFDQGRPDQDEQGGRVFVVRTKAKKLIEIELGRGDVNASALAVGAIVWKTDDPAIRKRLAHSFSRDTVAHREPITAHVRAHVGERLTVRFGSATVEWDKALERAMKFPFSEPAVREQLGRLGDTPFELADLTVDAVGDPMVPKSVLNDLRRQAVAVLLAERAKGLPHDIAEPDALARLRAEALSPSPGTPGEGGGEGDFERRAILDMPMDPHPNPLPEYRQRGPELYVLVRSLEQLDAVLPTQPATVYCDFEDVRKYRDAVVRSRAAGVPIGLATIRIVKPGEEGFLRQVAECEPDLILVRNLAAIGFYRDEFPHLRLTGDYSLNVTNELTAKLYVDAGLERVVPGYDLSWRQLQALAGRFPVDRLEVVVHQHMPMFHMEHCVFCHTLSTGTDYRDCGRPCEKHDVRLRDRVGEPHPLLADVGCRNTVYNAQAQSAAEFLPEMVKLGLRHFRVELLREPASEVGPVLARYADVLAGRVAGRDAVRSLRVINQLGVTRGTLDRE
jgi:putative protease